MFFTNTIFFGASIKQFVIFCSITPVFFCKHKNVFFWGEHRRYVCLDCKNIVGKYRPQHLIFSLFFCLFFRHRLQSTFFASRTQSVLEYLAIVTGRRAADFGPGDRALMEKHLCKLRYGDVGDG